MKKNSILLASVMAAFLDGGAFPVAFRANAGDSSAMDQGKPRDTATPTCAASQEKLRRLLQAPDPSDRLQAALRLGRMGDSQAVSTLIDLLGDLRGGQGREAEDFLIDLAGDFGPGVRLNGEKAMHTKVRDAWARWWREVDEGRLLNELKKRTLTEADREQIQALVHKLGSRSFAERKEAERTLIQMGARILPTLKRMAQVPDAEVRGRIQRCIAALQQTQADSASTLAATARLIGVRKPTGAVDAILACLPFVDPNGLEELQETLDIVANTAGKSHPSVLQALNDKSAVRRAAAAMALCAGPWADHAAAIRKLLNDPDRTVRLKTALALASAGDAIAVPTLIALVAELPVYQVLHAEDYLSQMAGLTAPKDLPDGAENQKKRSAAWAAWWSANKDRVPLVNVLGRARLEQCQLNESYRGYTMLVQQKNNTVVELDGNGKRLWKITGLSRPCDAQVLPGHHVLIVEAVVEADSRVTERNLQGQIVWQIKVPDAFSAQRLPNGNTLVFCHEELREFNRAGKEVLRVERGGKTGAPVFRMVRMGNGLVRAGFTRKMTAGRKLPNGRIVLFETVQLAQLDAKGRDLKTVEVVDVLSAGDAPNEILENGHALITWYDGRGLVELDTDGKVIHCFNVKGICHGFRLPSGHSLATIGKRKYQELDKKWRPINETVLDTPAFRVKRR